MDNGLEVVHGCLRVTRELRQEFDLSFDEACNALLQSPKRDLVIDFGNCPFINSTYIGMVAATYFQAQSRGKTMRIIAINPLLEMFRKTGFEGFIQLEACGVAH